jgi:CheY-like chemotaxis protein
MSSPTQSESQKPSADSLCQGTSELNNLLQIISGTSSLIQTSGGDRESSEKYLAMLRVSIERAEKVAAELTEQAGGTKQKAAVHPDLAGFVRPKTSANSVKTSQSILLVDDEQMALILVQRILSEAGYDVMTAQSGFECLDLFRQRPYGFHLVLLDLTMPFMDGEETFQRLREIRADVPVVLCTGFVQQERLDRLMNAGLVGFLRKPLAPDEIVCFVRSMLQTVKYSAANMNSGSMPAVG